jgi:hypothetical protein
METHIWHAKRFKMAERWGVKYPQRCSDKSDRSTYRLSQHDSAVIIDKSYYCHIKTCLKEGQSMDEGLRCFKISNFNNKINDGPQYFEG